MSTVRPLAMVTGASTGIGLELARIAAADGYDLIIAADEGRIEQAADELRRNGTDVVAVEADLSTSAGVSKLVEAASELGRPIELLFANAGRGLGNSFLDQNLDEARRVVTTNIVGTIELIHSIGRDMRSRNRGKILITGSIAGFMPGSFQAVYNATKAFLNSFGHALRNELKETDVTVTILMPGVTETEFFERAKMMDTPVGTGEKDDPAEVARAGYDAMLKGDGDTVSGFKNKVVSAVANVLPASLTAEQHRKMAEPDSE